MFDYEVWLFLADEDPEEDLGGINMQQRGYRQMATALHAGIDVALRELPRFKASGYTAAKVNVFLSVGDDRRSVLVNIMKF